MPYFSTDSGDTGVVGAGWHKAFVRALAALIARSEDDGAGMFTWVGNHTKLFELCSLSVLETHTWLHQ